MSRPPIFTIPGSGCSNPAIMPRVVVFPHPEGPRGASNAPGSRVNVNGSPAAPPPKRFDTFGSSSLSAMSASWSVLEATAIDREDLSSDPAGLLARQKQGRVGDVFGRPEPAGIEAC